MNCLFDLLDSNNKGYISPKDLRIGFKEFGFELSK